VYLRVGLVSCFMLGGGYVVCVYGLGDEANFRYHVLTNREHGHFVLAIFKLFGQSGACCFQRFQYKTQDS